MIKSSKYRTTVIHIWSLKYSSNFWETLICLHTWSEKLVLQFIKKLISWAEPHNSLRGSLDNLQDTLEFISCFENNNGLIWPQLINESEALNEVHCLRFQNLLPPTYYIIFVITLTTQLHKTVGNRRGGGAAYSLIGCNIFFYFLQTPSKSDLFQSNNENSPSIIWHPPFSVHLKLVKVRK